MPYSRHDLDDGFALSARAGDCQLFRLAPGVVKVSYRGLASAAFVDHVTGELDLLLRDGAMHLFVDAGALRSYESEFRKLWTAWIAENKHQLEGVHILFQSRVVEMGVNLVNTVVGDFIHAYSSRDEFEKRLASALAAATGT